MKKHLLAIVLCSITISCTFSQFSFIDKTDFYLDGAFYNSWVLAVSDMNNDGLDDIAYTDAIMNESAERYLIIHYQNEADTMFNKKTLAHVGNQSQYSISAADLNNNGHSEVFVGGLYELSKLISSDNMDGDMSILGFLPKSNQLFFQGTNIVDINNDGLLDIFACNDDGANYVWENEGYGQFSVNTDWIDFSVNDSNGEPASGNYGSIWSDIDNDGDLDLYIAKCRHDVEDTLDVRRINRLYINNGDGTFSEKGEPAGLDIGWQSWTLDIQDINNDGYFDIFLVNHDQESQLFLNNGEGQFTEINNSGISLNGKALQSILRDFDNDGWVDLITAGFKVQIFKNNKDNTFTEIGGEFTSAYSANFAVGDLNNDGFIDAYARSSISTERDKIWINSAESENNHLTVRLEGTISNRNAIGAKVKIYGDWGMQIREVRSGEGYGVTNSKTQYFGLGSSTLVDSVVVQWPSGIIQTEYNIDANTKILIVEDELSNTTTNSIQSFQVFPNPVNDVLNINLAESIHLPAAIEIYDISSQLVWQKPMRFKNFSFDISGIEKGIYFVKIRDGISVHSKKIVVY